MTENCLCSYTYRAGPVRLLGIERQHPKRCLAGEQESQARKRDSPLKLRTTRVESVCHSDEVLAVKADPGIRT